MNTINSNLCRAGGAIALQLLFAAAVFAQGLPRREKLTLVVNGVAWGPIRTDPRGKVTFRSLHGADLLTVTSVAAEDSDGNIVFSVTF